MVYHAWDAVIIWVTKDIGVEGWLIFGQWLEVERF